MGATLLVALLLSAGGTNDVKLAFTGLSSVNVDEKASDLYSDYFAQRLADAGHFRVTTKSEVGAVIGFDRQKQLLGCSDNSSSCVMELAGALGVDGLVVGNLGRLGREYVVTLKVVGASDGATLATASTRAGDEQTLLDWMNGAAVTMAKDVRSRLHRPDISPAAGEVTSVEGAPATLRSRAWIPATAGAVLLVGGGVFYGLAASTDHTLQTATGAYKTPGALEDAVGTGKTFQTVGFAMMGAGAAAALLSAGLYAFGGASSQVAVAPTPRGFAIAGTFP